MPNVHDHVDKRNDTSRPPGFMQVNDVGQKDYRRQTHRVTSGNGKWIKVGDAAISGAAGGALIGSVGGGVGAAVGAVLGGGLAAFLAASTRGSRREVKKANSAR